MSTSDASLVHSLLSLALLIFSLHGVAGRLAGATSRRLQADIASPQTWDPAAPWLAPADTSFRYKGLHNDLDALLRVQNRYGWISVFTWTSAILRHGLNSFYTLAKYGQQPNYIVTVMEDESLQACIRLNLPCYNGTWMVDISHWQEKSPIQNTANAYGEGQFFLINWIKPRLVLEILQKGYHVHASDVDVVYLRPVHDSIIHIFRYVTADGIFATEEGSKVWDFEHEYINLINAGVFFLLSNNRTIHFAKKWLDPNDLRHNDQVWLNMLHMRVYGFCDSHRTCVSIQRSHHAAFWRHPMFFKQTSCTGSGPLPGDPCDPRRLYLHFLCGRGWADKSRSWDEKDLWAVDAQGVPMWQDGGDSARPPHKFLPCQGIAWKDFPEFLYGDIRH